MEPTKAHIDRISKELEAVGVSNYGKSKFAARYVPKIIHDDEHIKAVVYGRYKEGEGMFGYSAGMLIATDRRVIFLDHKPGFTSMDELTYDAVVGVKELSSGLGSSVTLHTRMADFTIRFANTKGIRQFMEYVEKRRLDSAEDMPSEVDDEDYPQAVQAMQQAQVAPALNDEAVNFLRSHDIGVLSTVDRNGNLHGATVYYYLDATNYIYFVTKAGTQKAQDVFTNQQVAFTVFDQPKAQTAQIQGMAEIVTNPGERQSLLNFFTQPRDYEGQLLPPPISTVHEESYMAVRITITNAKFTDYGTKLRDENL